MVCSSSAISPADHGLVHGVSAGNVRALLDDHAPVEAFRQIGIGDQRAGVLREVGRAAAVRVGADLREQVVVAEHVAEVERDAAAHRAAEPIDARRDVRLARRHPATAAACTAPLRLRAAADPVVRIAQDARDRGLALDRRQRRRLKPRSVDATRSACRRAAAASRARRCDGCLPHTR